MTAKETKIDGACSKSNIIVLDDDFDEIIDLVGQIAVGDRICLNYMCQSGVDLFSPPMFCISFYQIRNVTSKSQKICRECYDKAVKHFDELYCEALKDDGQLLDIDLPLRNDTLAIDDSDSDDEHEKEKEVFIDKVSLKFLDEHLDRVLSETMVKFKFETKVDDAIKYLQVKHQANVDVAMEVEANLATVRKDLDKMMMELFEHLRVDNINLPPLDIPFAEIKPGRPSLKQLKPIKGVVLNELLQTQPQASKTPSTSAPKREKQMPPLISTRPHATVQNLKPAVIQTPMIITPTKAPIVAGNAPPKTGNATTSASVDFNDLLSNKVIKTEAGDVSITINPPKDLPPREEFIKPPIVKGEIYYATRNPPVGSWVRVKCENVLPPGTKINGQEMPAFTYHISLENNQKVVTNRFVHGKQLALAKPANVILEVGMRVIALFKENGELRKTKRDSYYPGIVGESPTKNNKFRYLIFFDDGYAHYVHYIHVFPIYESSKDVWDDVNTDARPFIKKYLTDYPNRSMVRLCKNQTVRTEFKGQWHVTTVMMVDCSLVQMFFDILSRSEWIYRGSRRLSILYKEEMAASNRLQNRARTHRAAVNTSSIVKAPYVQYTRDDPDVIIINNDDEDDEVPEAAAATTEAQKVAERQRTVAKKSTRSVQAAVKTPTLDAAISPKMITKPEGPPGKIVYYTPRKQTPNSKIYTPHKCGPKCQTHMHTSLQRLKGYGPLAKPLLCGFYRLHYKIKSHKPLVVYKTPCGRTVRNMDELHYYLRTTESQLTVDLFTFDFWVRCLAEFLLEPNTPITKDLSNGMEEIQIPVVNYIDNELNMFTNYSTKRMPMDGVNLNLDPEFLVGCDCVDDCSDKSKCSCWKLTHGGIGYLHKNKADVGYSYRRLAETVFTGIYECNSRCKCAKTCLNRVVQNPLQHKLQLFKTVKRGWGIRCINDIPQGSFICIYAGALLTEQMANEGGKNYGDEYLAELDYIESVEKAKEDFEEEAYESDESMADEIEERPQISRGVEKKTKKYNYLGDLDFVPSTKVDDADGSIRTRLRKRTAPDVDDKAKEIAAIAAKKACTKSKMVDDADDTVMISDDDEVVREPSSFNPENTDDLDETMRKYRSVRDMFGEDECVYIMDAKNTGNIGRYLNHSCSPNVFVQNVFVDTHDVRFPWVSFFASQYIRAGTELTWNYNYDIGSVQDKVLYCECGSSQCKGRLL